MQRLLKTRVLNWLTILLETSICQFAALTHQAKILGILRSPETMSIMNKIVSSLKSNPYDSDGFPLLDHLADDKFASWDDYTTHMARDGTYGRQITLYAGDVAEGLTHSSRKNETELEYWHSQ